MAFDFPILSPRIGQPKAAKVLLTDSAGKPALLQSRHGKGTTYLLNFCLQDSYFAAWEKEDSQTRKQLHRLIAAICKDANLTAHVCSTNAQVQASLRVGGGNVFLVVVCHETTEPKSTIHLADLPFVPSKAVNVEDDREMELRKTPAGIELDLSTPPGTTYLIDLQP